MFIGRQTRHVFMAGVCAGIAVTFILIALLGILAKARSETWLTVPLASRHFSRAESHNELNYGLGLEHRLNEKWSVGAGYYRNSNWRDSFYAGASYLPYRFGSARFGTSFGVVTGYERSPLPVAFPSVAIEGKAYGVNIVLTPIFVGVQVKYRWD